MYQIMSAAGDGEGRTEKHFLPFCPRVSTGRKSQGHSRSLVSDWSEEDVQMWLQEEGLGELVGIFKANNMDGAELIQLKKETLAELGIGE